jgi:hypothetical protein
MNAKTCLETTGEGIARAEIAPNGNWDVWAYFGCGIRHAASTIRLLGESDAFAATRGTLGSTEHCLTEFVGRLAGIWKTMLKERMRLTSGELGSLRVKHANCWQT